MKCQRCNEEYIPSYSPSWDMSCPNRHGHVKINTKGQPIYYRFYVYPNPETRITIEQSPYNNQCYMVSHTKPSQQLRDKYGRFVRTARLRKQMLKLDKLIPVHLDENDYLLVDKLYEKMKIYLLFS